MNLEIQSFTAPGDLINERLVLKASASLDVGDYAIFQSTKSGDGKATAGNKIAYWFPDSDIKSGDLVVLYTKSGTRGAKQLESGKTAHFFYWGLQTPIWKDENVGAVVLLVDEWKWKPKS